MGCSECELAAQKLGMTYKSSENEYDYPKGCYVISGTNVYCNKHNVGSKRVSSSPICKMEALKPPKGCTCINRDKSTCGPKAKARCGDWNGNSGSHWCYVANNITCLAK